MSLDRDLAGLPFRVDLFRCHEEGKALKAYRGIHTSEPWSDSPKIDQLAFKVLFISICHQMNWDVLQSALAAWLLPNTSERLTDIALTRPAQIATVLADYPKQERVRAQARAVMLRETARSLVPLLAPGGAIRRLFDHPILNGPSGFYEAISHVMAYTGDPFDKKARVLAHDLYREGILKFVDPENLKPAVEYHLIRLYLRSGRVAPTGESVREELSTAQGPARRRLVMLLRGAVDEAMRQTAFYAGLDIATLNYVEWQIGRSICVEELGPGLVKLHCLAGAPGDMPDDIRRLAPRQCTFADTCSSLNDPSYGWFREPQFQKAIY